jgi:perosamine synthetase
VPQGVPPDVDSPVPLVKPWFPPSYAEAVRDQVLSGFIGPGRVTEEFTTALARLVGASRALATVSGTAALTVAAHALGLRPGDEVLVPAYGVISTINAFASAGLHPRLVDIDRRTACLSPSIVADAFTARTRAVCFVNFSGYTDKNLVEIASLCRQRDIPLIEDAACALGHSYKGRAAGTFGDVGAYSFSVPKVLTTGQGGALVAHDNATLDRAAAYIDHGDLDWRRTNLNREVGTNLRLTDLQAALGLCQLRDIDERLQRRRMSYAALQARLGDALFAVPGGQAPLHNIVLTSGPDALVAALKRRSIGAVRQYRTLSQHPAYRELARQRFPNADCWTDRAVYLPFGMAMTAADAARVAEAVIGSGVPLDSLA